MCGFAVDLRELLLDSVVGSSPSSEFAICNLDMLLLQDERGKHAKLLSVAALSWSRPSFTLVGCRDQVFSHPRHNAQSGYHSFVHFPAQ